MTDVEISRTRWRMLKARCSGLSGATCFQVGQLGSNPSEWSEWEREKFERIQKDAERVKRYERLIELARKNMRRARERGRSIS